MAWFLGGVAVLALLLILLFFLRRHPPRTEPKQLYERRPQSVMWESTQRTWGSVACTLGTLAASLGAPQFFGPLITDPRWSETREAWLNVATQFATAATGLALVLLYHAVKTPYVQLEDARRRIKADDAAADFDIAILPERWVSRADAPLVEVLVTNRGTTSEFEAFVEAAEGMEMPPRERPALRWKDAEGKRCSITRGHSETLIVAAVYGGDLDSPHNVGLISFQVPGEDGRLHGRVFASHGDLLAARVTIYLRITSLDPWAQKEWPIYLTYGIDMKMIHPRVELGPGRVV